MESKRYIRGNKIALYPEELAKWVKGDRVSPITVELHLSNDCTLSCNYCNTMSQRDKRDMEKKDIFTCIDKLKEMGVQGLIFSGGGEPTLNEHLGIAIKYATGAGLKVGLITNGVIVPEVLIDVIVSHCSWVRVSLDTLLESRYKEVKGGGNAEAVLWTIKALAKRRDEISSNCTVGVQTVVTDDTIQDIEYTNRLLLEVKGLDYYQIRPLENKDYSPGVFRQMMSRIRSVAKKSRIAIVSNKWQVIKNFRRNYDKCYAVPFIGAVGVDGLIYICCHKVEQSDFVYGNLLTEDIDTILKNREKIAGRIDLNHCPIACRGDQINRCLEEYVKGVNHKEFL